MPDNRQPPSPLRYRKLRIAWSVGWGVLCVLLIALWVRSYFARSSVAVWDTPSHGYYLCSTKGKVVVRKEPQFYYRGMAWSYGAELTFDGWKTFDGLWVLRQADGGVVAVGIRYWLILITSSVATALPLLHWRFSLRTLLITITLAALALGIIVATTR